MFRIVAIFTIIKHCIRGHELSLQQKQITELLMDNVLFWSAPHHRLPSTCRILQFFVKLKICTPSLNQIPLSWIDECWRVSNTPFPALSVYSAGLYFTCFFLSSINLKMTWELNFCTCCSLCKWGCFSSLQLHLCCVLAYAKSFYFFPSTLTCRRQKG